MVHMRVFCSSPHRKLCNFDAERQILNVYSSMKQEYFTPRQVAHRLRVDYATVTRWIRTGLLEVETIREGRRNRYRIRKATIETLETPLSPPGLA
jgi:excisionase family DNA binding protein